VSVLVNDSYYTGDVLNRRDCLIFPKKGFTVVTPFNSTEMSIVDVVVVLNQYLTIIADMDLYVVN